MIHIEGSHKHCSGGLTLVPRVIKFRTHLRHGGHVAPSFRQVSRSSAATSPSSTLCARQANGHRVRQSPLAAPPKSNGKWNASTTALCLRRCAAMRSPPSRASRHAVQRPSEVLKASAYTAMLLPALQVPAAWSDFLDNDAHPHFLPVDLEAYP